MWRRITDWLNWCKQKLKENWKEKIFYGGTFSGNSINTYVGYETLNYILKNKKILNDINKKSEYFETELNNFFQKKNIMQKFIDTIQS